MLDNRPRSAESLKSRNSKLLRRSVLKMKRGGKRTQLRKLQKHYKEGRVDLLEGLLAQHSLQRKGMYLWVVRAPEADHEDRALELGARRVVLVRARGRAEDEEQDLDA